MSNSLTLVRDLGEKKLATLTEGGMVKQELTNYYNSMMTVGRATWDAYDAFALAYANMASEKDAKGEPRFKTKGQFYDFVGVNDSTGSLILRAVKFNSEFRIDDKSLRELGFTACKVDMLSHVGADDMVSFLSAISEITKSKDIRTLADMSDASLKALIKRWKDAGKPAKFKSMDDKKQEKQEKQETTQETTQEATREAIFSYIDGYTGGDTEKIKDLIKMIKKHYGIR